MIRLLSGIGFAGFGNAIVNTAKNHMPERALQPAGLVDTMNDTICCIIGTGLAVIV